MSGVFHATQLSSSPVKFKLHLFGVTRGHFLGRQLFPMLQVSLGKTQFDV